jgi:hypothetical protein
VVTITEPAGHRDAVAIPKGLYDPAMGAMDAATVCETCKSTYKGIDKDDDCPGHFGCVEVRFRGNCCSVSYHLSQTTSRHRVSRSLLFDSVDMLRWTWSRGIFSPLHVAASVGKPRISPWLLRGGVQDTPVHMLQLLPNPDVKTLTITRNPGCQIGQGPAECAVHTMCGHGGVWSL